MFNIVFLLVLTQKCISTLFLTFLGPCIANIFPKYNQQDATFQFIYFCKLLYVLQTGFLSIIRNSKLHMQHQANA